MFSQSLRDGGPSSFDSHYITNFFKIESLKSHKFHVGVILFRFINSCSPILLSVLSFNDIHWKPNSLSLPIYIAPWVQCVF